MCGHVGVAGRIHKAESDIFQDMLYCDALRGMDATGVGRVGAGRSITIFKNSLPSYELMGYKAFDNIAAPGARVLIGHNRSATVGNRDNKHNAHPFEHGDILGAHNGTLPYDSRTKLEKHNDFGTDSEALFYNIARNGIEETIPKIWGAWALVYYDARDNTINFLRNDQRTLFYVLSEDKKTLLWSSEVGLLHWITSRRNYKVDKPRLLTEDTLKYWTVPEPDQTFGEPAMLKINGRSAPTAVSVQPGRPYGYTGGGESWHSQKEKETNSQGNSSTQKTTTNTYANVEFSAKELLETLAKYNIEDPCSNWWFDPKLDTLAIEFDDDTSKDPWAWTPEDDTCTWIARVKELCERGFEYGDPKATLEVVIPPAENPDLDYKNFLSKTTNSIWNVARNKAQALPVPKDKLKGAWWSVKHKLWVFNRALVDYDLSSKQVDHYFQFGVFISEKINKSPAKVETSVLPFSMTNRPPYKNPQTRQQMTKSEFNIITKRGCDWCQASINWGDAARFAAVSGNVECFCSQCADKPEVQQYVRS